MGFTEHDVPDQTGRTAFVTGANTGIGFHIARVLASRGARVLLGCRNAQKADDAMARIRQKHPNADLAFVSLDLGYLQSIRIAAERVREEPLHMLINNAGIMLTPYQETKDGFESQFGVNHLGTFALTGLLLDHLERADDARVVVTASLAHRRGKVRFGELNVQRDDYSKIGQYALSKLANVMHAYELDRRLRAHGRKTNAIAVHPGVSDTELTRHMGAIVQKVLMPLTRPIFNSAAEGAWPALMAATSANVHGGEYLGPEGMTEMSGEATRVQSSRRSHDVDTAKRLWDVSIEMTGVDPGI